MIYLSEKELARLGIKGSQNVRKKQNKYNAQKTDVDGIKFDSLAEANYYLTLKLLLRGGKIAGFCRQPRFVITEGRDGERGTEYVADFIVFNTDGTYDIIDVKGKKTDVFKLKQKCMREKYPALKIVLEKT